MADKAVKLAVKAAREACSSKDYSSAVKACQEALALDATHYDSLTILGRSQCGLGRYPESEAAYQKAIQTLPDRTTAYQGLAELYATIPDLEKQEEALKTLLKLFAQDKEKQKHYQSVLDEVDKKLRPPKERQAEPKKTPARQPSKKNSRGAGSVSRCSVAGCGERLNEKNTCKCKECGALTCLEHQYPIDHDCPGAAKPVKAAPRPASGSIGVIKKKPPAGAAAVPEPQTAAAPPAAGEKDTEMEDDAVDVNAPPPMSDTLKTQLAQVEATVDGLLANSDNDLEKVVGLLEARIAITVKKQPPGEREAGLLSLELLVHKMRRRFEPLHQRALALILFCLSDGRGGVSTTAMGTLSAFCWMIQPAAMDLVVPALVTALDDRAFRVKEGVLTSLVILAKRAPHQVGLEMPSIFPALSDCLKDTHPKVNEAAEKCLDAMAKVITQPETLKIMVALKKAILKPAEHTHECLDQLMETTFVNAVDAASLSWLVPVVARGLREPSADLVKKAATTAGNVCALISDSRDILPFVPMLLPGLTKAVDHSHPDVRAAATKARVSLLKGAKLEDETVIDQLSKSASQMNLASQGSAVEGSSLADAGAKAAQLASTLVAGPRGGRLSAAEVAYVTALVASIAKQARSVQGLAQEVEVAVWPLLEPAGVPLSDCHEMCQQVEAAVKEVWTVASGIEDLDYLVRIEGIILAFAGKVLLARTNLLVERKHRYGLVGQNGMGKTTLLNRIAAGDIKGFPKDISVYYIQHEILSEGNICVKDFMLGQVPAGTTEAEVEAKLLDVGFTDVTMAKAVTELSGGWRMKLAIARSMLWNADFLLLDEPTNHLDKAAVQWLADKINSLSNTTVALVSHDYDFLELVCTDIIHIADQALTYYKCGFKEFQRARPEIVAALPSPENAVRDANVAAEQANQEGAGGAAVEGDGAAGSPAMARVASALSIGGGSDGGGAEGEGAEGDAPSAGPATGLDKVGTTDKPILFPDPGRLEGIVGRRKTVMRMDHVSFKYPSAEKHILTDATGALCLASRVALIGVNGAGKTTMLKLLVGELEPDEGVGEVWKHHNLRVSYIAQHSMHHLEASLEQTPLMYIQNRFYMGRDKEVAKMTTLAMTEEDKAAMQDRGAITKVVGRQVRGGNKLWYEVTKLGRRAEETDWEPMQFLEKMPPYVMKLIKNYDELVKAQQSGMAIRPITSSEVRKHLADFGIDEDLAGQKIKRMSGGQRSRLVLAAANWAKPHLIALDEPTNYLDNDTLAALTHALKTFKGAVLTISHNQAFVSELCTETWLVENGTVTVTKLDKKDKKEKKGKD